MNDKKQSSIEWLVSILNKPGFAPVLTKEEIEQAKAMHKEEMINFSYKVLNESNDSITGYVDEEKIYNLTFGGEDE